LIDTCKGDYTNHRIAHQVSTEVDHSICCAYWRIDQLPDLGPGIVPSASLMIDKANPSEWDPIVGDGRHRFVSVVVDRDSHKHQAIRSLAGM
jgi:hypothetical protein